MRKSEREVKDAAEKFAALLRCGYMTLAVARGEGAPYLVPLNFGAELAGERLTLYFHCAREGDEARSAAKMRRRVFLRGEHDARVQQGASRPADIRRITRACAAAAGRRCSLRRKNACTACAFLWSTMRRKNFRTLPSTRGALSLDGGGKGRGIGRGRASGLVRP